MKKRVLGRTGVEVGVIGIGVEHLNISKDNMDAVFDLAVESDVNYVDLVYNDPLESHSRHWQAIAPAIQRHRDSLVLCAHWGFIDHEPIETCERSFNEVLELTGNGFAEIAMMTMVDQEQTWREWAARSILLLREYQRDRRIGFIGLSTHKHEIARLAVESGLIDVLMFPVNLYGHPQNEGHSRLLDFCEEKQVGVVAMKPYYGGKLISSYGRPTGISPAECLHYVLSQPVSTVVPGFQSPAHLRVAVESETKPFEASRYGPIGKELSSRLKGQCVQCQHCLPCPAEIRIPAVIQSADYLDYYSGTEWSEEMNRSFYDRLPVKASACTECGVCMDRCPFEVDVIGKMHRAVEIFSET